MAWKFDQPLYCLSDEQEQKETLELWEKERHGGLWTANNRLPLPLTYLIALIILTAFMVTMPIWGQRPNAAIYEGIVANMDSAEVQRLATGDEKIKFLFQQAMATADSRLKGDLERHPLAWDDLVNIAPGIKELQAGGGKYPLDNYNVIGDRIALANFEGNTVNGVMERKQPWWDKGYTIDMFYVAYFMVFIVLLVKRLPHYSRKPDMSKT